METPVWQAATTSSHHAQHLQPGVKKKNQTSQNPVMMSEAAEAFLTGLLLWAINYRA